MPPSNATPPSSVPVRPTPPRALVGTAGVAPLSRQAVAPAASVAPVAAPLPIVASIAPVAAPVVAAPPPMPVPMPLPFAVAATPLPIENPFLAPTAAAPAWVPETQKAAELAPTLLAAPPAIVGPVIAPVISVAPVRPRGRSFTWEDFRMSPDPIAIEKMKPEAQLRRAKLTRYVKAIVAGCAALCLVALVRSAVASESDTSIHTTTAASAQVHGGQKVVTPKVLVTRAEEVVASVTVATKAVGPKASGKRSRR